MVKIILNKSFVSRFIALLLGFLFSGYYAIGYDFKTPFSDLLQSSNPKELARIPFQLIRNKIILPVRVNGSRELQIILDTGMPSLGLLLFDKTLGDELNLSGPDNFRISGAGEGKTSYAMVSESNKLSLADLSIIDQRIIVLQSDTMIGYPTDGVIGGSLFRSYTVKIDYDLSSIFLFHPSEFIPGPSWKPVPLTFKENNIPFLNASISIKGEEFFYVFLYIDLASSEALEMLVGPDQKFQLPDKLTEKYLGRGLDGDIYGQYGRIFGLKIGSFILNDVPTAFPKKEIRSRQEGADGVLSNNALRRFNVVFDYSRNRLYLIPNKVFPEPFKQD